MGHDLCERNRWDILKEEFMLLTNTAIACVFGSSIICVDLIIQHIPGKQNFRIQDSNVFLSASLSLSFGVMVRLRSSYSFFW